MNNATISYLVSWFWFPKQDTQLEEEASTLINAVLQQLEGGEAIELSDKKRARLSAILTRYVYFVRTTYPKERIPPKEQASKRHYFLSAPNWLLQQRTVSCIRKTRGITKLSLDDLEHAWQEYSDWRSENANQPLMAETWRAFHHLLGYYKHLY